MSNHTTNFSYNGSENDGSESCGKPNDFGRWRGWKDGNSDSDVSEGIFMPWQFFHLLSSLVLLPVLTATFILSKSIKRRLPTLINICFVWFMSGHIYSLLYYGGNNKPTPRLCKIQAALMTGVHPMWFTALLMLVVHVTLILKKPGFLRRVQVFWMIIAPYLMFLLWALVAVYGLSTCSKKGNGYNECLQQAFNKERQFVRELHSYKNNDAGSDITQAMSIFTLIIGILIIGVESHLAVDLHGFYKGLSFSHHIDICLLVRVVFFSVYISVLGAMCFRYHITRSGMSGSSSNMLAWRLPGFLTISLSYQICILLPVVFLIFGTHPSPSDVDPRRYPSWITAKHYAHQLRHSGRFTKYQLLTLWGGREVFKRRKLENDITGLSFIFISSSPNLSPPIMKPIPSSSSSYASAQITQYLSALNLTGDVSEANLPSPTLENLHKIHILHTVSFPFDTTAIHYTPTHAMDVTSQGVFRHFVAERRGGSYCFGHNVLLLEVLKGLGYHVYSGGAELEDLLPPLQTMTRCAHMILFVQIPGDSSGATYVADVGLGVSGLIRPILLSDDRDNVAKGATPCEAHRLRRIPTPEGHEGKEIDVATRPFSLAELEKLQVGRYTLDADRVKRTVGEKSELLEVVKSEGERIRVLRGTFGILYDVEDEKHVVGRPGALGSDFVPPVFPRRAMPIIPN
ncbi:hypothetical protein BDV98DRAFT_659867 [Pterulicium gracile]|uniref:Uncharacterized protein n=1 Tax=Pterulicium gracile TaxID=1884261 RepID=A0A5C3Q9U6_9AGAR|nr:hypothetical protein BDV98DRAFT_659867 [Pterula gracilis]